VKAVPFFMQKRYWPEGYVLQPLETIYHLQVEDCFAFNQCYTNKKYV